MLGTEMVPNL